MFARRLLLGALAAAVAGPAAPATPAAAAPAWMPAAEVRPGMRGVARTVVSGTAVESFDVQVLEVIPGAGPAGDLILVRASGPLIARTGGIAAGMSGSPVYVNGRLIGAIGFGWAFADHSLGLVTPIETMLSALPPARAGRRALARPIQAAGRRIEAVAIASTPAGARAAEAANPRLAVMLPLARPLLMSAMGTRAADLLSAELGPLGVSPIQGGAGMSTAIRPDLVPGSAIGVQLVRGDLNIVAIGTLTYRDGDRVLAFGHPFLNRGHTRYLLTAATIHGVVPSQSFPFKIGSAGAPVGIVVEDRRSAIAGRLGALPPVVGVRTRLTDADRGRSITLVTQVLRDPQLGPVLALASALEAVDRALDRVGEGTARVRITMRARGLDGPLVRDNVFYHPRDIGAAAMLELPEALRLLFANEFVQTGPVDVAIDVEVQQRRQTAALAEADLDRPRARQGEVVTVRILLRPFQGPAETRVAQLEVPDGFPVGQATVLIRAGGRPVPEQGLPALLTQEPVESTARSAAEQLSAFADRDRNTDLIVELAPGAARFPDGSAAASRTARVRVPTPWVVRGRVQLTLGVDPR
jgi:hypothetical protein